LFLPVAVVENGAVLLQPHSEPLGGLDAAGRLIVPQLEQMPPAVR